MFRFRLVYVDACDACEVPHGEYATIEEVRRVLDRMIAPQRDSMRVYDAAGQVVDPFLHQAA